jgi:NTE family protein
LIFAVHIWNPDGQEPETITEVLNRQKDIQYCSRTVAQIRRQEQIHRLRHIVAELAARVPQEERDTPLIREMASYGCLTRMHVVRLLAPQLEGEDHTKDIDFSRAGIRARWEAGSGDARRIIRNAPWRGDVDPLAGFSLHECRPATEPMR